MSFLGSSVTLPKFFSCFKLLVPAGTTARLGGQDLCLAYDITEQFTSLPVVQGVDSLPTVFTAGSVDCILVGLRGLGRLHEGVVTHFPGAFDNATIRNVSATYNLPTGEHGILLEGIIEVDGASLNADTNVHFIPPGSATSGTGVIVTFAFTQT